MIRRVFVFFSFLLANYKHWLLLWLMPMMRCCRSSSCCCCCYYCYGRCRCHKRLAVAFFRVTVFFSWQWFWLANSFRNERSNHEKNVFPRDHHSHTTIAEHNLFWIDADDDFFIILGTLLCFCMLANTFFSSWLIYEWFSILLWWFLEWFQNFSIRKSKREKKFISEKTIQFNDFCKFFQVWNRW